MNKRFIIFILLMILAVLVAINAILHEQAYREQSRAEIQQMQQQLDHITLTTQELGQHIKEVQQSQAEVKQFLDSLNILPDVTVTYYAPFDSRGLCHDGTPNTTATGTKPCPGTFAVDPRMIPLGSRVVVMYADGTVETGQARDTGGSIKGNRIDCFRWTHAEAMRGGKRKATVAWMRKTEQSR